jgi:hypothetical protein
MVPHPLPGTEVQLCRAAQLQLFLDAGAVSLHRGLAKAERLGNLPRAFAASEHLEDLQLAVGECFQAIDLG